MRLLCRELRNTATPTQRSKNKQPRGSPRSASSPADTAPQTHFSRSYNNFDYAEQHATITTSQAGKTQSHSA
jgi:hypothetical protein